MTNVRTWTTMLSFLLVLFSALSCRSTSKSNAKVAGGKIDYTGFTATLLLKIYSIGGDDMCTATVVTDTLVLTAAHCLDDTARRVTAVLGFVDHAATEVDAKSWRHHPDYRFDKSVLENGARDLAFVTFDSGSVEGATVAALALKASAVGDLVTLVGYGNDSFVPNSRGNEVQNQVGAGTRRSGVARISQIDHDHGFISLRDDTGDASTLSGDSGGPLYNQASQVVGVAASGHITNSGTNHSHYVDIFSPDAVSYIQSRIPGFNTGGF